MSRYRRIEQRMWADAKFRALSDPQPCGKWLWLYLLTGPDTTALPGLFRAGRLGLTESLGWSVEGFDAAWAEIESAGMAAADWDARVVWVPNAMRSNPPESPNVVSAWRARLAEVPECPLRETAQQTIETYLSELGPDWFAAWNHGSRSRAPIPPEIRKAVKKRDKNLCAYCEKPVSWTDRRGGGGATYDHVDPRAPATLTNIVVACRNCNSRKGLRTPAQAGMRDPRVNLGSNLDRTQVATCNQEQEQEQEQEQDQVKRSLPDGSVANSPSSPPPPASDPEPQHVNGAERHDAVLTLEPPAKGPPPCPVEKIAAAFRAELPMCPTPRAPISEVVAKPLRTRWREDPRRQDLDWWVRMFRYIRNDCPFLVGQSNPTNGREPFVLSLLWLVKPTNFEKVIAGEYDRKKAARAAAFAAAQH